MKQQVREYTFVKDATATCPYCCQVNVAGKSTCTHLVGIEHSIFPTQETTEKFVWTFEKRSPLRLHLKARR